VADVMARDEAFTAAVFGAPLAGLAAGLLTAARGLARSGRGAGEGGHD
jgi:hypothetical protein